MLTEVQEWLTNIHSIASTMLQDAVSLNDSQTDMVKTFQINAELMLKLVPALDERIASRNRSEAIRSMSTEWRTPITSMLGYSKVLLMGIDGQLAEDQRSQVMTISEYANLLWQWSNPTS